jgi:predicted negative regulator of RcsB-dependent stress response
VRADVRHQLKEDRFRKFTAEQAHWAVEHRDNLVKASVAGVIVLGLLVGGYFYFNHRDELASGELSKAVRTYNTPIRPAGSPEQPEFPTFASLTERATKAHAQFEAIATQYPHTKSADFARYFSGLTSVDMGDNAAAEKSLKQTADASSNDLSALAKMALASLYHNTNRDQQAIELYQQLTNKPSLTVSKPAAQMELAGLYASKQQTADARKIYEQLQKDNPNTEIASMASSKLQELIKK